MKTGIGIACLIAGVLLIVWGYNLSESVSGQFNRVFTGSPGSTRLWRVVFGVPPKTSFRKLFCAAQPEWFV